MKWVIIVMYVLSALLPIVGLCRLVLGAYADKRTPAQRRSEAEADPRGLDEIVEDFGRTVRADERRGVWLDLVLIGLGLALGSTAGILSLP